MMGNFLDRHRLLSFTSKIGRGRLGGKLIFPGPRIKLRWGRHVIGAGALGGRSFVGSPSLAKPSAGCLRRIGPNP